MSQLKESLCAAYDGFIDKRMKSLLRDSRLILDYGVQGDGRLTRLWSYGLFCFRSSQIC